MALATESCPPARELRYRVPAENNDFNGLVCPYHYNLSIQHTPPATMRCTADETWCFDYQASRTATERMGGCCSRSYGLLKNPIGGIFTMENVVMKVLLTKAASTSLLPVVHPLYCYECNEISGWYCMKVPVLCAAEDTACVSVYTQTIHEGKNYTVTTKRCGKPSECQISGTVRSKRRVMIKHNSCCYTDQCEPPKQILPSVSSKINGLTCPVCYMKTYGICLPNDYIQCYGNETQCMKYTSELSGGYITTKELIQGCASPKICNARNRTVTNNIQTFKEAARCTEARNISSHLYPNTFTLFLCLLKHLIFVLIDGTLNN